MFHSRQCPLGPHYPGHTGSISSLPLFPARLIGQHSFPSRGRTAQPAYQPTGPSLPAFCLQSWWEVCVIWFHFTNLCAYSTVGWLNKCDLYCTFVWRHAGIRDVGQEGSQWPPQQLLQEPTLHWGRQMATGAGRKTRWACLEVNGQ